MTSLSKEEENYVRMSLLLTGVSAGATRTLFNQEFPNRNLESSMKKEFKKLCDLKKRRVVTQRQWNRIFTRSPDVPDSMSFDATLMITLLRHLTDLNPPHGGFDKLPSPSEKTPGSDLARIKYYRDFLANLDDAKIDNVFFIHAWEDISEAIGRLGGLSLKQECDQLKTKILDQKNFQEIEDSKHEIEQLKQSLIDIRQFHESANPDLFHFAGTSEEFQQLLSVGTYESFENRVFLCGSCACGKSTLASILIGSPIPRLWKSTDGLVIHFGRNGINLETYEMVPLKEDIAYVRLQEIPCDEVLNGLPMNLGNCAIQLGIELGITLSSIEETLVRYHKDMYGQISDILRKWKISREVKPTIYRLMLALERVDTGGLEYLKKIYLA